MSRKIVLECPKCKKKNDVLYLDKFFSTTSERGSTGIPHFVTRGKSAKVSGKCECGYVFKVKDLDI